MAKKVERDLTGQQFGWLTPETLTMKVRKNGKRQRAWWCLCKCGVRKLIYEHNIIARVKPTLSCGCMKVMYENGLLEKKPFLNRFGAKTRPTSSYEIDSDWDA